MPRRNAFHAVVRGGVVQRGRHVGRGQHRGEVAEVEVGLDEVGQRQGGRGVGGAVGPGGVEDGPCAGDVAADGDPAPDLDDGGVAAGPCGEVPECAAACGEQGDAQLFVRGAADTEDGDAGPGVGGHDAYLVGAPVTDRPQGVGVAPQQLGADRLHGLAVVPHGPRGPAPGTPEPPGPRNPRNRRNPRSPQAPEAPTPPMAPTAPAAPAPRLPRRCCSIPPTTASPPPQAVDNQCTVRTGSPCCHEGCAPEHRRSRPCSRMCSPMCPLVRAPTDPHTASLRERRHPAHRRRLRRECAPATRPHHTQRALNCHGGSGRHPKAAGSIFGQITVPETRSNTLRTGSRAPRPARGPGDGTRLPDRSAARGMKTAVFPSPLDPVQRADPRTAHGTAPRWPEKSARTGARPHNGSTRQQSVQGPHFSTDHNPAIRNNAP